MGSLGGEFANKAMWFYPKISGFTPPERWGHSACFFNGLVYVYGGCCGGLHFSDVLVLSLSTMSWTSLTTKGAGPGPRDSHSVALWGHKMLVFGGTNGLKKLNDLHVLDLVSNEWTEPLCTGSPPCPRESHTSTLVGEGKLVIFGGSGEGIGNYLNDLHVLDLKSMVWSSTNDHLKGNAPSPRDSHVAASVGDELFVFGGDSGDRYHGEVHRFDMKSMSWMKLVIEGSNPGARAGHAVASIGHKVYLIGGVGDKQYYDDTWILDTNACSWSKLNVCGSLPQGRFSHTAIVAGSDIVVYGGCGEDERPLREILVLRLKNHHPHAWRNISPSKGLGKSHYRVLEKKRCNRRYENLKAMLLGNVVDAESTKETLELHSKRRRSENNTKQSEAEQHSLSVSQHSSSPSQSDQEQTIVKNQPWLSQFPRETQNGTSNSLSSIQERPHPSMIGAEVRGKVDGAFDSGYLMTAYIDGRVFRGVLFSPVYGVVHRNDADLDVGFGQGSFRPSLQPLRMSTGSDSGTEMAPRDRSELEDLIDGLD
ncbi:hypothetical protein V2J09_007837 [Rumex salicifolius]